MTLVLLGLFDDVERVARALDRLHDLGIPDERIELLSGLPIASHILGRPPAKVWLPPLSVGMAVLGLLTGSFFAFVTPNFYVIRVGAQPIVPIPPSLIILFELTMLFLIVGTFLGFLFFNYLPTHEPTYHAPIISDGEIGLVVHCEGEEAQPARDAMEAEGALEVQQPERRDV